MAPWESMYNESSLIRSEHRDLCILGALRPMAEVAPTRIAVTAPGRVPLTYSRLSHIIYETRDALRKIGVGCNDRVAIVIPTGVEMAVALIAIAASATCAPLNPAYRLNEFDFYLSDLQPKALLVKS